MKENSAATSLLMVFISDVQHRQHQSSVNLPGTAEGCTSHTGYGSGNTVDRMRGSTPKTAAVGSGAGVVPEENEFFNL